MNKLKEKQPSKQQPTLAKTLTGIQSLDELTGGGLPKGRYVIEVVDLLQTPRLAQDDQIVATPTLIEKWPPPCRRLVGDLTPPEQVSLALDLQSDPE